MRAANARISEVDQWQQCARPAEKKILVGGVTELDARYCNQVCRGNAFFNRFNSVLSSGRCRQTRSASSVTASPTAARKRQSPTAESDPITEGAGEIAIIGIGIPVVGAVSALIWFIYEKVNYPFFAQTVWFVIPIGAFLCGMVAGIGFFLGHPRFQPAASHADVRRGGTGWHRGLRPDFWTELVVHGIRQSVRLRDVVGFSQFLQVMVENQRVQFRHGAPIDLGKWGYARFVINLAGFALGVVGTVAIAGGKAYCACAGGT